MWVARVPEPEGPYAVRFEMENGKGILRVSRSGAMMEPPARSNGTESRLSALQLRSSRFTHLWGRGTFRQSYVLSQLEESALEELPLGQWVELKGEVDGGIHYLLLPEPEPSDDVVVAMEEADDETSDHYLVSEVFRTDESEDAEPLSASSVMLETLEPEESSRSFMPLGTLRPGADAAPFSDGDPHRQIHYLKARLEEANRRNLDLERRIAELERKLAEMRPAFGGVPEAGPERIREERSITGNRGPEEVSRRAPGDSTNSGVRGRDSRGGGRMHPQEETTGSWSGQRPRDDGSKPKPRPVVDESAVTGGNPRIVPKPRG